MANSPSVGLGSNMARRRRMVLVSVFIAMCAGATYLASMVVGRNDTIDADDRIRRDLSAIGRSWSNSATAELLGRWKEDGVESKARAAHRVAYDDLSRSVKAWKLSPDSRPPASALGLALIVELEPALVLYDLRSALGLASHLCEFADAAAWAIGPTEISFLRAVVADGHELQAMGALNVSSKLRLEAIDLTGVFAVGFIRPEPDVVRAAFEWLSRSRIDPNDVIRELEFLAPRWDSDNPAMSAMLRRLALERKK